jgi:transmembrane sensor
MRIMGGRERTLPAATQTAAAAWVVKLQASDAGEAEWLAFEAWLVAEPDARPAFDAAMATWLAAGRLNDHDLDSRPRRRRRTGAFGRPGLGGTAALGLGGSLAAAVVAWLVLGGLPSRLHGPRQTVPSAPVVYAAAPGEQRTVVLADGTRMDLSSGSRVAVSLDAHARKVAMASGEVAFLVTHDPARPFSVTIGDRQVRDIGTEFDIARAGPQIRVTVKQGEVAVAAMDGSSGASVALGAGRQLVHDEDTGASSVHSVPPDEAVAWKQGRLIYRDQPLRVVVEDLNRYFPNAVRIEDEHVAALRFTGVLAVDKEEPTIRRLVALMPISADHVGAATVLRARSETR